MKALILLLTTAIAVLSEKTVLVQSTPESVRAIYPANKQVILDVHNSKNYIGFGPQWVWIDDRYAPNAVFQILFYSDCPHMPAEIVVAQDDQHVIYLNGQLIAHGGWYGKIDTYKLNLHCGLNNLTIKVINTGGPGSLIFKVVQEQANCFNRPAALYNYQTCSFQCSGNCNCPEGKHWTGYPACGCKCNSPQPDSCDQRTQRFDEISCSCVCKANICPPGLEQDTDTCDCRCKAQNCPTHQQWNYYTCSCEAFQCVRTTCSNLKIWSEDQCSCICPNTLSCPAGQVLHPSTCTCY